MPTGSPTQQNSLLIEFESCIKLSTKIRTNLSCICPRMKIWRNRKKSTTKNNEFKIQNYSNTPSVISNLCNLNREKREKRKDKDSMQKDIIMVLDLCRTIFINTIPLRFLIDFVLLRLSPLIEDCRNHGGSLVWRSERKRESAPVLTVRSSSWSKHWKSWIPLSRAAFEMYCALFYQPELQHQDDESKERTVKEKASTGKHVQLKIIGKCRVAPIRAWSTPPYFRRCVH